MSEVWRQILWMGIACTAKSNVFQLRTAKASAKGTPHLPQKIIISIRNLLYPQQMIKIKADR